LSFLHKLGGSPKNSISNQNLRGKCPRLQLKAKIKLKLLNTANKLNNVHKLNLKFRKTASMDDIFLEFISYKELSTRDCKTDSSLTL